MTKSRRNCSSRNYPWWIFWDSTTNETSVSGNSQPPNSARPTPRHRNPRQPHVSSKPRWSRPITFYYFLKSLLHTHPFISTMSKEHLSVVVCGHVDAGELSTRRNEFGGGGSGGYGDRLTHHRQRCVNRNRWHFIGSPKSENDIKVHWHR